MIDEYWTVCDWQLLIRTPLGHYLVNFTLRLIGVASTAAMLNEDIGRGHKWCKEDTQVGEHFSW